MVHLVYCDDKEKVLEKILEGSKTMIIRAAESSPKCWCKFAFGNSVV